MLLFLYFFIYIIHFLVSKNFNVLFNITCFNIRIDEKTSDVCTKVGQFRKLINNSTIHSVSRVQGAITSYEPFQLAFTPTVKQQGKGDYCICSLAFSYLSGTADFVAPRNQVWGSGSGISRIRIYG